MGLFSRKKKKEEPRKTLSRGEKDQLEKVEEIKVEENTENKKIQKTQNKNNKKSEKENKHDHGNAHKVLIRPIITEKSAFLGMNNQYVFEVSERANKIEVKKSIEKLYGVKPTKINIIKVAGKKVRYGRKFGMTKSWVKAVVTLKQDEKIDIYEGV